MKQCEPSALEMMQAMFAVLNDPIDETEAILLHAAPARDDNLDHRLISKVVEKSESINDKVVINGLTEEQCRQFNLAYIGVEKWKQRLLRYVSESNIIVLTASLNTAEETRNFLLLARERKWKRVAIASYPYHILRCFLQIVALMKVMEMTYLRVSCTTFCGIDWKCNLEKPVLNGQTVLGGGNIVGALPTHIEEEYKRIVAYAQDPKLTGRNYTRHATIKEMFEYLEKRES